MCFLNPFRKFSSFPFLKTYSEFLGSLNRIPVSLLDIGSVLNSPFLSGVISTFFVLKLKVFAGGIIMGCNYGLKNYKHNELVTFSQDQIQATRNNISFPRISHFTPMRLSTIRFLQKNIESSIICARYSGNSCSMTWYNSKTAFVILFPFSVNSV
jgi:hypothetical protein